MLRSGVRRNVSGGGVKISFHHMLIDMEDIWIISTGTLYIVVGTSPLIFSFSGNLLNLAPLTDSATTANIYFRLSICVL